MEKPFKRKRDEGKRHAVYWVRYVDESGRRRMTKGFRDKGESARLQAKLQHEADLRRRGLIDAKQEAIVAKQNSAIADRLKLFQVSLKDNTEKHVKLVVGRVRRLAADCSFQSIADIESEKVKTALRALIDDQKKSIRTRNHYLQAFQEFCGWLVATGCLLTNPLTELKALNAEVDIKHKRRALSQDEFKMLVETANASQLEIQCYDGKTRARIYWTSYATGLRRNEIGSLTPESFKLKESPATVTVEAAFSKHRKRDVLPLHPEFAQMVAEWLTECEPNQPLFPLLGKRRTWLMVKKDLETAGIAYETVEGIADFHAAGRHTYITELMRNGVTLPQAKELARHADVRQTMKYTHVGMDEKADALKRLPWHHIGSNRRDPERPPVSPDVTSDGSRNTDVRDATIAEKGGYGTRRRSMAPPDNSGQNDPERVRLPALLAAMTLLALLAAMAGPFFRQQSAAAQRSRVAYWLLTLAVAIGGFVWRRRRMTTPNPLMGTAHWQITLVRRSWRRDMAVRIGVIVLLVSWLAWEAMQFVRIHDRFAQGPISRTFEIAMRGLVTGWVIGLGLLPMLLKRPAFICQRGLWTFGKPEVFWSKLAAWQWLPERPGVMKLSETKTYGRSRELLIAIPTELRLAVEDYVREKTELTIPDSRARRIEPDDAKEIEGETV